MATQIAGHHFEDTPNGRRCTAWNSDGCSLCLVSWLHVRTATEKDVGERGFAHIGKLNYDEYRQIVREREQEEANLWTAVIDAASAGSR